MTALEIKPIAHGSADYQTELEIRQDVLRKPLGRHIRDDDLSGEERYYHLGAYLAGTLVGVLYIKPLDGQTAQIKQVAVLEERRKDGVGGKLMQAAEEYAKQQGFQKLVLEARADAAGFYLKQGYAKTGEQRIIFRIPHFRMEKPLQDVKVCALESSAVQTVR